MLLNDFLEVCSEFDHIQILNNRDWFCGFGLKNDVDILKYKNYKVLNIQIDSEIIDGTVNSEFTITIDCDF